MKTRLAEGQNWLAAGTRHYNATRPHSSSAYRPPFPTASKKDPTDRGGGTPAAPADDSPEHQPVLTNEDNPPNIIYETDYQHNTAGKRNLTTRLEEANEFDLSKEMSLLIRTVVRNTP